MWQIEQEKVSVNSYVVRNSITGELAVSRVGISGSRITRRWQFATQAQMVADQLNGENNATNNTQTSRL